MGTPGHKVGCFWTFEEKVAVSATAWHGIEDVSTGACRSGR
jgi:hypothetical protein